MANSTGYINQVKTANLTVTAVNANGSYGSNGQVLVSNGTAVFWGTGTSGANTQVQFNDSGVANATSGFTFDKTTNTLSVSNTINVGGSTVNSTIYSGTANNSTNLGGFPKSSYDLWITSNAATAYTNATAYADTKAATAYTNSTAYTDTKSTAAYTNAMADTLTRNGSYTGNNTFGGTNTVFSSNVSMTANNLFAYSSNVYANNLNLNNNLVVNGNITLGNNITDIVSVIASVNTDIMPSANVTYSIGNNTIRWLQVHAQNVHSTYGYFEGDVSIGGNLVVTGNLTTVNVNSVIVSDPLLYLAGNNYSSDLVDIGFAGNYFDGVTERHTGVIRHAATDQYYMFKNLTQELSGNNVVNIADPSFKLADLNAYLISGGLVSNSTAVTVTANSTVNVNITANTISLSSPLSSTSGGTGYNTYTIEDILVANSTNGFRKLSLGAEGYVLQSNGTALIYSVLDGGAF